MIISRLPNSYWCSIKRVVSGNLFTPRPPLYMGMYGNVGLPMHEEMRLQPVSLYGVTKLATEDICYLYWKNYGVPTVLLCYFTVYGPRQRPDMGIHNFFSAIRKGNEITVYGDGSQTRDFTYIEDAVSANIFAAMSSVLGEVFNIGGGNRIRVLDLIRTIEEITGKGAHIRYSDEQKGDISDTWADVGKAFEILDWQTQVWVHEGLIRYRDWVNVAGARRD